MPSPPVTVWFVLQWRKVADGHDDVREELIDTLNRNNVGFIILMKFIIS